MPDDFSYRSLFDLSGKTALVTGACGILGQHICAGLAEAGAAVALLDIGPEGVRTQANELSSRYGAKAIGFPCDVSDPASVREAVAQAISEFGRIDILHNNAAGKSDDPDAFLAPFEDYDYEQWRKIMAVNLDGMFLMAQAVGKHMVAHGGGSIIQTSSIYGLLGPDQRIYEGSEYLGRQVNSPGVYATSKAGIIGLTLYLATYWADKGVRVNAIAPGGVASGQNNEFMRRYSARIPLGRMAKAHEMVGALLYLASDASSYVTGQTLAIDGGLTAW
jgi:NAD(P)-dependent dehydrogenase (short-subunit alcohol dehydrogenase family)